MSTGPPTGAPPPTLVLRPGRALIGWMDAEAGRRTLAGNRVEAAAPEQTSRLDRARGAVQKRPVGLDQSGVLLENTPSIDAHATAFWATTSGAPLQQAGFSIRLVDLRQMCAFQPVVFTDTSQDRTAGLSPDDHAALAEFALPLSSSQEFRAAFDPTKKAWVITSPNPNLQAVGQASLRIAPGPDGTPILDNSGVPFFGFPVAIPPS